MTVSGRARSRPAGLHPAGIGQAQVEEHASGPSRAAVETASAAVPTGPMACAAEARPRRRRVGGRRRPGPVAWITAPTGIRAEDRPWVGVVEPHVPPWASTTRFAITSPSPRPPARRSVPGQAARRSPPAPPGERPGPGRALTVASRSDNCGDPHVVPSVLERVLTRFSIAMRSSMGSTRTTTSAGTSTATLRPPASSDRARIVRHELGEVGTPVPDRCHAHRPPQQVVDGGREPQQVALRPIEEPAVPVAEAIVIGDAVDRLLDREQRGSHLVGGPSSPASTDRANSLEALADARRPRASERASSTAARTWLPSGAGVIAPPRPASRSRPASPLEDRGGRSNHALDVPGRAVGPREGRFGAPGDAARCNDAEPLVAGLRSQPAAGRRPSSRSEQRCGPRANAKKRCGARP